MKVAIHQPAYLPWLGYFDRIQAVDTFVFLDTVQFEKNSFTNRNKLRSDQGSFWLTVPVRAKGHTSSTLADLEISGPPNWSRKHLSSIYHAYRKAPRFDALYPQLESLYGRTHTHLADLCFEHLEFWLGELGIETRVVRASALPPTRTKSELVLDLCEHLGAERYLSGTLGRDYLDVETFTAAGIEVEFQDYAHPTYPQVHGGEFISHLGVVDLWMNTNDPSWITRGES